jgi:hypothetical protein
VENINMNQDDRRFLSKAVAGTVAVIAGLLVAPVITITATIAYLAGRETVATTTMPEPAESEDKA